MIKTFLFRWFLTLVGKLPLVAVQHCGHFLGRLLYISDTRMKLVTQENIERCYPQLESRLQSELVLKSLQDTSKTIIETAIAWTAPLERCRRLIIGVESKTVVDHCLAAGKGLVFVIPHLGNWELINHYLGLHYGLTHMYQPNKNPALDRYIQSCRDRTGTRFVATTHAGIRAQLITLNQGGTVGIMPDQEPDIHTGDFASFFGTACLTNLLACRLAQKTGASLIIAYCKRLDKAAGFEVIFQLVKADKPGETPDLQQLNNSIESAVRTVPEQYLWSYKRFRTRPRGELDFYQFDQHPVRKTLQRLTLQSALKFCNLLSVPQLHLLAEGLAPLAPILTRRRSKVTRVNLHLCRQDQPGLEKKSMVELFKTGLETGKIWHVDDISFESLCFPIHGTEYLPVKVEPGAPKPGAPKPGVLILTPPIGNREVVMRYLGHRFDTTEYYHSNSRPALDQVIREQRSIMGIRLVDHSEYGRSIIEVALRSGHVATLCPDQQPRVRGGIFVPLFSSPALTSLAIPELLRRSGAKLLFGTALRQTTGFQVEFCLCEFDLRQSDLEVLVSVNHQLEDIITTHNAQYRWSDKRFNIRPPGDPKVYR